jgi:6-phosphogluconate dehydrogenase
VQLGMIGLGRMGASMARRLMRGGHALVVYDVEPKAVALLAAEGGTGSSSLRDFCEKLAAPRAIWMMLPVAFVEATIDALAPLLARGDVLIDGGNSRYHDDLRRAERLARDGIHYVDIGTSGGVAGLERGYCLMIGGEPAPVRRLEPIFETLAPGIATAARTPGRDGPATSAEAGFLHCGPHGAGHFVKMIHNGIEYGIMAAYAEGLDILRHANAGMRERVDDAETTPLEHPEHYRYDFDLAAITEVWRRGSVIGSWLLDLTARALLRDAELAAFGGRVSDSGEGRWTIQAAVDVGVPAHVLTASLYERFASRGEGEFAGKVLSAMRFEFGGHAEKPAAPGNPEEKKA